MPSYGQEPRSKGGDATGLLHNVATDDWKGHLLASYYEGDCRTVTG